jgi:hexulose-6-phosphate isomerase
MNLARREFLRVASTTAGAAVLSSGWLEHNSCLSEEHFATKPWIRKTLKIGMIQVKGSLTDKFKAAKKAGFEGVELNAPDLNPDEAIRARDESGLVIDGTVGGYHWQVRHTDPNPDVRADAIRRLHEGIAKTAAVGGDSMLLVPGHGKDGSKAEVFERAQVAVKMVLEEAEKKKVRILIENVWNHMFYDHEGNSEQTADEHAAFVDSFNSPWVGMQFDLGNHHKYGDVAAWTRTLGKRILKLDIKGFSRAQDKFVPIVDGDIDWASVRKALVDVGFTGWCAAEVGGGDLDQLREISDHMETALHCSHSFANVG